MVEYWKRREGGVVIDREPDPERESIWATLYETRNWYFGSFMVIATILETLVVTGEIGKHGSIIELCRALIGPSVQAMELSVIGAYVVTDTGRIIMVLAKSLEDWYKNWQKRRIERALARGRAEGLAEGESKGRALGLAEGESKGRAEERQLWVEWNERRDAALARGEEFTEPPPNGKV